MFVRFVQDVIAAMDVMVAVLQLVPNVLLAAPNARQVANLAVLMVEMMELIQTAHQNGLRKVTPKTNGRGKPLFFIIYFVILFRFCLTSKSDVTSS